MTFDSELPGEFVIIDKKSMVPLENRFNSAYPFLMLHMMNAYQNPENNREIILDTTVAEGDIIEYYNYEVKKSKK